VTEFDVALTDFAIAVLCGALAFGVAIALGAQSFALAVGAYVPASTFLAYAFAKRYRSTPWPELLSPNACYHLLQFGALAMLFAASTGHGDRDPQTDS